MPSTATDALVLRTYALGETSLVVVLLTRERGRARAVAKGARGARPRYRSALEPLSEVRATLYGRQGAELLRLGDCELRRSRFPGPQRGVEAALALSHAAELLDAFSPEGEADEVVYRLALAFLGALEEGGPVGVLQRYLEAWLLRRQGVYPPLDRCAGCASPLPAGELAYHEPAHGFVCASCGPAAGPVLPEGVRRFLADVFRLPPADMAAAHLEAAAAAAPFHRRLIEQHLERRLRSPRVLAEVSLKLGAAAG
jgi:DNA repair protein RecO (recombination protein O)